MKKQRKIFVTGIMVAAILFGSIGISAYSGHDADVIDKTVHKYAPVGASVAIIEHGEIKEIRNYGYANRHEKKKVTDETRFKIASISKTVTAYGIMQLVEQGKLDLDAPVNAYLTKWKIPESEYGEDRVTLRMLLSHTAGVTGSNEYGYSNPLPTIDEALKMHDVRLKRKPGEKFEYSEFTDYGICQLVIEEVTGMPFEEYMEKEIFDPLGMNQTDYANETNAKGELAIPYAGLSKATNVVPIVMNGGGGVTTTSHDLALFEIALMKYYKDGCGEMFQEQKNTKSAGGTYALGIIPRYLQDGRTVYEHNGTLTGWNAQLAIEPESQNGIAVVSNSDKAYYMTYDLMEVWSKKELGECVSDSLMKQIQNVFRLITCILLAFMLLFGMIFIKNILQKHYSLQKGLLKKVISVLLFVIITGMDMIIFYTDLPGKIAWKMKNYYLFTFFPTDFGAVQVIAVILFAMLLIRMNLKKNINR